MEEVLELVEWLERENERLRATLDT
jgi:hypothetical protein